MQQYTWYIQRYAGIRATKCYHIYTTSRAHIDVVAICLLRCRKVDMHICDDICRVLLHIGQIVDICVEYLYIASRKKTGWYVCILLSPRYVGMWPRTMSYICAIDMMAIWCYIFFNGVGCTQYERYSRDTWIIREFFSQLFHINVGRHALQKVTHICVYRLPGATRARACACGGHRGRTGGACPTPTRRRRGSHPASRLPLGSLRLPTGWEGCDFREIR